MNDLNLNEALINLNQEKERIKVQRESLQLTLNKVLITQHELNGVDKYLSSQITYIKKEIEKEEKVNLTTTSAIIL